MALSEPLIGCFSVTVAVHTHGGATLTPATAPSTAPPSDEQHDSWWLTVVYGPQEEAEKTLFLEEIAAIRGLCDGAWLLVGDFNLILDEADKNNGRINRRTMRRFRRVVAELELMDIHLHGRRYTWSNERQRPTMVRLDRALTSLQWEERFPSCHLRALSTDASDHCPIMLQTNVSITVKPRFHFEIFWSKLSGYQEALQRGWQCSDTISDPLRRLDAMFRNLSTELKSWSARQIGVVKEQLLMAREIILRLDQASDNRTLSDDERKLRAELKGRCLGLSSLERTIARQRARVRHLADRDANTKYFHMIAQGR